MKPNTGLALYLQKNRYCRILLILIHCTATFQNFCMLEKIRLSVSAEKPQRVHKLQKAPGYREFVLIFYFKEIQCLNMSGTNLHHFIISSDNWEFKLCGMTTYLLNREGIFYHSLIKEQKCEL